ncbi:MPN domain-containing protein CG4751 isoform X2 [Ceratitis capitata]|uniref:MPN domain-containing protein CG4751 n=1 Tax=Ceratitis capitata TaxID=7213 RepID=W8BGK5_CERCA|nr:MPN domain-containing protein CG4751 isoform X2 [Ceratitis capitata]
MINELEKTNSDWSSHCRKTTIVQETGTNLEERDADSEEDTECEAKENYEGLNGTTRTVTLQTLMSANILHPGKSLMTIDYLGQKFVGDLMPDGKIKSHETETIFLTPSAWAMHCKRIINPEKKSGCGWGSVKYKGKKLDTYKNSWLRKCALQKDINMDDSESADKRSDALLPVIKRIVCPHNTVINRNILHDGNMLIKAATFNSTGRVQPFLVTFNSSALLLADFHCHLTMREVCGYFGGHWDINTHTLIISKTYPCRNFGAGTLKAAEEECNIRNMILQDQLLLVGWYHSHPKFQAEPSLRDCDAQLDYQIRMRGSSDVNYTPCISTIISPYFDENPTLESVVKSIWIIPPNETKQILEYGRPMLMQYSVLLDEEIPEYVRSELQSCVLYYTLFRNEFVRFNSIFNEDITFIEKLKNSLYSKFPTKQDNTVFWNWICDILGCAQEDVFIPPKTAKFNDNDGLQDEVRRFTNVNRNDKLEKNNLDKKGGEIKVMSLQEQLCLPSGLNMNPVRTFTPLAASTFLGTGTTSSPGQTSTSSSVVTTSSGILPTVATVGNNSTAALSTPIFTEITPHNSPITVPSSSASPVKSDQPIQGSPLSPKPDILYAQSQSPKNQINPNQSIGNISNKYSAANQSQSLSTVFPSTTNDLVAASLAQLAGQIAPNFLPKELATIFQPQGDKNFGSCLSNNGDEQKNDSKKHNMSHMQEVAQVGADNTKNKADSFLSKASNLFKTKLMRELDKTKNDPIKINELMRSSEYATLLLQQAEALGATTLGTLGLGQDLNFISSTFESKNDSVPTADHKNMAQVSKLLGYDACIQLAKSDDINAFIQQQMGAVAAAALANVSVGAYKNQKPASTADTQADYGSLLQTYSKLFGTENSFRGGGIAGNISSNSHNELSAALSAGADSELSSFVSGLKSKDIASQNQQRESDNQNQTENLMLYHQNKTTPDLGMLFASSSAETNLSPPNKLENSNGSTAKELVITDPSLYFNTFSRDKTHDYPFFQQQNIKQDGNFFISPDAIMKIQKDSLSAIMMKPPKSTTAITPTLSHGRDGSTSPAVGRLTPVKSAADFSNNTKNNMKYNFSAMDLAVSSIQPNTSIALPIDIDHNLLSHRRPSNTPPVDLSRFYSEGLSSSTIGSMKKRMEYSSVAELAAPPPAKMSKANENTHSKM